MIWKSSHRKVHHAQSSRREHPLHLSVEFSEVLILPHGIRVVASKIVEIRNPKMMMLQSLPKLKSDWRFWEPLSPLYILTIYVHFHSKNQLLNSLTIYGHFHANLNFLKFRILGKMDSAENFSSVLILHKSQRICKNYFLDDKLRRRETFSHHCFIFTILANNGKMFSEAICQLDLKLQEPEAGLGYPLPFKASAIILVQIAHH